MTILETATRHPVTHPQWCDPDRCTVLPGRPVADGAHTSTPEAIEAVVTATGTVTVLVWLRQGHPAADDDIDLVVEVPQTRRRAAFPLPTGADARETVIRLATTAAER